VQQTSPSRSSNPSPSCIYITRPSEDIERPSDEVVHPLDGVGVIDADEEPADTSVGVIDVDKEPDTGIEVIDVDEGPDIGDCTLWDPHAGMKPSQFDGCGSDGELELDDELPYGGAIEVNVPMVDMMIELGDNDARDGDWLPSKERRKLDARIKGKIVRRNQENKNTHWCQGKRKAYSGGPDVAAKSE
jgi:hypothetical protein